MSINLVECETTDERARFCRKKEIKRMIEALLFASAEPLMLEKLKKIVTAHIPSDKRELRKLIEELRQEYHDERRAFQIDEIGEGYLLRTAREMGPFVELLHQDRRSEKLSRAATEVLALIGAKSPITRAEIEKIRGVDSSGTVASLVERGLIESVGRAMQPGRPIQFGITRKCLQHFGLKNSQEFIEAIQG